MLGRSISVAIVAASLSAGTFARADDLSPTEAYQLLRGRTVARMQNFERGERRYVGGVTYTIVDADAGELAGLLDDIGGWRRLLPNTRRARPVGTAEGDTLVEVTHGSAIMQVTYTLRVHHDANVVRFWMDSSRPHDIDDAWGFFRSEPLDGGRTLVTYGVLIDMGAGILRSLFEDRVRELALSVPDRFRWILPERRTTTRDELLVTRASASY